MNIERIEKAYRVKTIIYRILQISGIIFFLYSFNYLKVPKPIVQFILFPFCLLLIFQLSFELFVKSERNKYFGSILWKIKKLIERRARY